MIQITNGEVYDPLNRIKGERIDIWVDEGRIVGIGKAPAGASSAEVIDASGSVVMPGGVDIHAHIAGSKVNHGRKLRPEDHRIDVVPGTKFTRSGVGYTVPSTFVTGYRYAVMGYTTVMEAAVPPLGARHSHEELNDTLIIDKACFILMGSNHFILKFIEQGEQDKVTAFVSWLLRATRGYSIKAVNPGGMNYWQWGENVEDLDQGLRSFRVTPRQILRALAGARKELGLPHPIHVHCNRLGIPGNYATTLKTMEALEDFPLHITHAQFNSFGGTGWVDTGQVVFGEATTMTADGPFQYQLHKQVGRKWVNCDVELEAGAGIVPYIFQRRSMVNATQWTIGLELLLLIEDPWRIFLTTDHPNAGPFIFYPYIIKLLMNRDFRDEVFSGCSKKAHKRTTLPGIKREYSLHEIAIITRAGTARALGLKNKGHLGVGADADIAIYDKDSDVEKMFASARNVLKEGEVVPCG